MGKATVYYLIDEAAPHDRDGCLGWDCEGEAHDVGASDAPKCSKCHWFGARWQDTEYVKDSLYISHAYSDPLLSSEWYIENLGIGTGGPSYSQEAGPVRRIVGEDVKDCIARTRDLAEPLRDWDREACEETMGALRTFGEWLGRGGIRVGAIISDGEF